MPSPRQPCRPPPSRAPRGWVTSPPAWTRAGKLTRSPCSAAGTGDTAVGSRAGLAAIEAIIDASGVAPAIEALLPAGVRHRQLPARTLLAGMMLTVEDRRPAYLTEGHAALTTLPADDQKRLRA